MKKLYLLLILIVMVLAVTGWLLNHSSRWPAASTARLKVTTSFYPLYFFASQIAGDKAEVVNMTPPGAEPHGYELTAKDLAQIEASKLFILNGFIEPWESKVREHVDTQRTMILVVGKELTTSAAPHLWLSPLSAQQMVDKMTVAFATVDPVNAAYYRLNAQTLRSKLAALDRSYREGLAHCATRELVTSHAAFEHLAHAYQLRPLPIAGLAPHLEPSSQQLARVVDEVKKNRVKVIFLEPLTSPKLAETVAAEIGGETMILNPLEGMTAGELAAGKDYFSEMRQNLAHLKKGLQCIE